MPLRTSTESSYARVLAGLRVNQVRLFRAQEQVSTGRSILRPSDDPIGTARSLSLTRRLAGVERYRGAAETGRASLDQGAVALQSASEILTEVRELFLQGMNGTLGPDDREAIATEIEVARETLMSLANTRVDDRYIFGGTLSDAAPWVENRADGVPRVLYGGNDDEQRVEVSDGVEVAINMSGAKAFGQFERTVTDFAGLTGLASGITADEGIGYEYLELRHDSTQPGLIASVGLALVDGGANDSLLGDQVLTIDPVAGTVQLGSGEPEPLPGPADAGAADFLIRNELGAELHLDFTGYTGGAFSGVVRGEGSISIDGSTFTPLTFTETDLELKNEASGNILHFDATAVGRAGRELVHLSGSVNVFDTLQGMVEDLRNADELNHPDLLGRMDLRLGELDRNHDNVGLSLGILGARSARIQAADQRLAGVDLQLQGLLSDTRDADLSEVVVDMVRAEQTLQLAQASGTRLIQTSLLDFLR
ncbi:MAG: flagellar hook-associated protein FlgL [Planctomycetota bacterium]